MTRQAAAVSIVTAIWLVFIFDVLTIIYGFRPTVARSWIFLLATGIGSAVALGYGFILLARARLMEDTPLSLIRSAAQGYVELQGTARTLPGPPIVAPLSGGRCCWWRYRIDFRGKRQQSRDPPGFWEMAAFIGVLLLGYLYILRRGALDWD